MEILIFNRQDDFVKYESHNKTINGKWKGNQAEEEQGVGLFLQSGAFTTLKPSIQSIYVDLKGTETEARLQFRI